MGKIDIEYLKTLRENEGYIIKKSKCMSLKEIVEKIVVDKDYEYIFDFVKHPKIKNLILSIKNRYQVNKDEVEDVAIFCITEYFYVEEISLDNFDETVFVNNLKNKIGKRTKAIMREGYSVNEVPVAEFRNNDEICVDFDELIIDKLLLNDILHKLTPRNREILELYVIDKLSQQEIADIMGLSQRQISRILAKIRENSNLYV